MGRKLAENTTESGGIWVGNWQEFEFENCQAFSIVEGVDIQRIGGNVKAL